MATIDPNIALGGKPLQLENPLAQYSQFAQIQNAQNQNALAQYQLSAAKRADDINTDLLIDLREAKGDPNLIQNAYIKAGKAKEAFEIGTARLNQDKLKGEIAAQPVALEAAKSKLVTDKLAQSRQFLTGINPADPNAPAQLMAWHDAQHADPILGPVLQAHGVTPEQSKAQIDAAVAQGPQAVANLIKQSQLGIEKFTELNKPSIHAQDKGAATQMVSVPGLGGDATVVPGSVAAKTLSPYESAMLPIHQGQLGVSRAGLGIRAAEVDPFGLSGIRDKFPVNMGTGNALAPTAPAAPANALIAPPAPVVGAGRGVAQLPNVAKPSAPTLGNAQMSLADAVKSGVTGNDLLAYMPKSLAAQVTAITDHRAAPPERNTNRGSQITQLVQMVDPTYDATQYKTKQGTETAFTSGRLGTTVRSFNVVNDHLTTLGQLSDALQNNDVQLVNKVGNFVATQTGGTAPTNFDAAKRIVADEVTKAVLGSAGALGDRKAVDDAINAAKSPEQLKGVIKTYQDLINGQLNGFRQQYKAGGGSKNFDTDILGRAPAAATSAAIPQNAIDALKAGKGTDEQFDAIFGAGAAKRARGGK